MPHQAVKIILALFVLVASLPLIQKVFHPFKLVGLNGAFEVTAAPDFSFNTFLSGKYQQHGELYIKDQTPFKSDMVRFRNQLNFLVYGDINTNLTLGKENYIFDPNYINAIEGKDLHSDSLVHANNIALSKSMKILTQFKVPVFFIITPNKADFYKEYLAKEPELSDKTNAIVYKEMLQQNGVKVFDANEWFIQMKPHSKYPLMPKYGAHWSMYGAMFAVDSLLNFMNANGVNAPVVTAKKIELSDQAKFTDDDYMPSLNLMWKWKSPQMAYPVLGFSNVQKPDVLVISDSYFWNFYDYGVMEHVFGNNSQMWYYNKSVYDIKRNKVSDRTNSVDCDALKKYKAIIIMSAEPSLRDFSFGFFNQLAKCNKQ